MDGYWCRDQSIHLLMGFLGLPPGPVHHSFGGPLEPAAGTSSSLSGGLLSGPVHPSSGGPLGPAAVTSSSLFWRASEACCQDQFIPLLGASGACCQVQFIPLLVGLWGSGSSGSGLISKGQANLQEVKYIKKTVGQSHVNQVVVSVP